MKNSIPIMIALLFISSAINAQGILGFFTQQETQKKDMIEQITLLTTYGAELKNGYKDTENGLNTIHSLKNGTFTLHTNYFNSLSQVNPEIAKNPKVKAIINYQQQINAACDRSISWQKQQQLLSPDEISYLQSVYNNLLNQCAKDLDELTAIVTPGSLQLQDDERLKRIDVIYADMEDKSAFCQYVTQNMQSYAEGRKENKQELKNLSGLYNLN